MSVSVIMSVFNDAKYISESLLSIIDDLSDDDELIIVNDCSVDDTLNIIQSIIGTNNHIKLITNEVNLGLAASLNKAFEHSKGDYIARMDSDDINIKGRIPKLKDFLIKRGDVSIVGCNALLINENGHQVGSLVKSNNTDDIITEMLFDSPMIHPTVMIRRNTFSELNGYNEDHILCQDYNLWVRAVILGKRIENINIFGLMYRISSDFHTKKVKARFLYSSITRTQYLTYLKNDISYDSLSLHCTICGDDRYLRSFSNKNIKELVFFYNDLCSQNFNRILLRSYVLKKSIKLLIKRPIPALKFIYFFLVMKGNQR